MTTGQQNKIRAILPTINQEQLLADLDKVQDWTEEPTKQAAKAIEVLDATTVSTHKEKTLAEGVIPVTTRFPASVAQQVRKVAGSTYGMTINSFVVDAVREKLKRLK